MDTNLSKVIDALSELKSASMSSSFDTIQLTMKKYNMLFLGEKLNTIFLVELQNTLKEYFHFNIDLKELKRLIPTACQYLGMAYEPMSQLDSLGNTIPEETYSIILWE